MSDIQMDTLEGRMLELTSATEGLGIAFFDTFDETLKGAVETITDLVSGFTDLINVPLSTKMEEDRMTMMALFEVAKDTATSTEDRAKAIAKINEEYDEYLPQLLSEKDNLEDIEKAQKSANDELMKSIILRTKSERLAEVSKEFSADAEKRFELQVQLREEEAKLQKFLDANNITREEANRLAEERLVIDEKTGRIRSANQDRSGRSGNTEGGISDSALAKVTMFEESILKTGNALGEQVLSTTKCNKSCVRLLPYTMKWLKLWVKQR